MKARRVLALAAGALFFFAAPARADWWQDLKDLHEYKWARAKEAFYDGRNDYYLSGYIWHAPWAYTGARRHHELNDIGWGGGFGRSVVDANGNAHSLYAIASQDSHYKPQYLAGYMWLTYWPLAGRLQGGLGYSFFLFSRDDIGNRFPLPGFVPAATLRYREAELVATFVPGVPHAGNVGYLVARFNF
jgi:lipid IVA palmitoyltransferase